LGVSEERDGPERRAGDEKRRSGKRSAAISVLRVTRTSMSEDGRRGHEARPGTGLYVFKKSRKMVQEAYIRKGIYCALISAKRFSRTSQYPISLRQEGLEVSLVSVQVLSTWETAGDSEPFSCLPAGSFVMDPGFLDEKQAGSIPYLSKRSFLVSVYDPACRR
jgi:hypothetical protein